MAKFTELNSKEMNETNGGLLAVFLLAAKIALPAVGIGAALIYNTIEKSND